MNLKKAQISLEMLIVISILIIGATLFGVFYLQNFKDKSQDINFGTSQIGFIFEDDEPEQILYVFNTLQLSLIPPNSSDKDIEFKINVKVLNVSNFNNGRIKKIEIKKNGSLTNECKLKNGIYNHTYTDVAFLEFVGFSLEKTIEFSCKNYGVYNFEFTVVPILNIEENLNYTLSANIDKVISSPTSPTFTFENLQLNLVSPSGPSVKNTEFGINVKVLNVYNVDEGKINKIQIKKDGIPTYECKLKNGTYDHTYTDVNFLNFSNSILENNVYFSCLYPGIYNFTISVIPVIDEIDNDSELSTSELSTSIDKNITESTQICSDFKSTIKFNYRNNHIFYNRVNDIKLDLDDPDCSGKIYYTIDGSIPTEKSINYVDDILLLENMENRDHAEIKAIAIGTNTNGEEIQTEIASSNYIFKVEKPIIELKRENNTEPIQIILSSLTSNSKIYYTLDGRTPTIGNNLYKEPITISETTTVKAIAFKKNYLLSDISNYTYTFETSVCDLSGDGNKETPYLITNPKDLYCINEILDNLAQPTYNSLSSSNAPYFRLGNDLNLDHRNMLNTYSWYTEKGFPSLGVYQLDDYAGYNSTNFYFIGHFDGGGYTIYNLYRNNPINTDNESPKIISAHPYGNLEVWDHLFGGLFGCHIGINSEIKNLNLINAVIINSDGILTGTINDNVKIDNVKIEGDINNLASPYKSTGGFASMNTGYIVNCMFKGTVIGGSMSGGLVANNTGIINRSSVIGNIIGDETVGGLVGHFNGNDLNNCYFKGTVTGRKKVGGLIGYAVPYINTNYINLNNNFVLADVNATHSLVSGLVGTFSDYTSINIAITNSYFNGNVKCVNCSEAYKLISFYNFADVSKAYYNSLPLTYCSDGPCTNDEPYGEEKSIFQLKNQNTYVNWDFTNIWDINSSVNNGFPYLKNSPLPD